MKKIMKYAPERYINSDDITPKINVTDNISSFIFLRVQVACWRILNGFLSEIRSQNLLESLTGVNR